MEVDWTTAPTRATSVLLDPCGAHAVIDADHAREASNLLGSAITAIIEDVHSATLEFHLGGDTSHLQVLEEAGQDVIALASAIRILKRRSELVGEGL